MKLIVVLGLIAFTTAYIAPQIHVFEIKPQESLEQSSNVRNVLEETILKRGDVLPREKRSPEAPPTNSQGQLPSQDINNNNYGRDIIGRDQIVIQQEEKGLLSKLVGIFI